MKLLCIDRTEGGLVFYTPFLSRINNPAEPAYCSVREASAPVYMPLFMHFKGLELRYTMPDPERFDAAVLFVPAGGDRIPKVRIPHIIVEVAAAGAGPSVVNTRCVMSHGKATDVTLPAVSSMLPLVFPEVNDLYDLLLYTITAHDLTGRRILISAGPTIEDIDPVRFLSNRSSGKMGIAAARNAFIRGADVHLIHGPVFIRIPGYLDCTAVRSAGEMAEKIIYFFQKSDVYVATAAIADYTPERVSSQKIKKKPGGLVLSLKRTTDILATLAQIKTSGQILVGFSVETRDELENSKQKLIRKKLDLVVSNNPTVTGAAFAVDTNRVTLITGEHAPVALPVLSKFEVAGRIFDYLKEIKPNL